MNTDQLQKEPLTQSQFEAAAEESEALYERGENEKAANILINLMERTQSSRARELVVMMLFSYPLPPELTLRLAHAVKSDHQILNELLKGKAVQLSPAAVSEITALRDDALRVWLEDNEALGNAETLYNRGQPTPETEAAVVKIIETTNNDETQKRAVWILCRHPLKPVLALRIARAAKDTDVFFAVLSQEATLPLDSVRDVMTWIVMNRYFDTNTEYSTLAEQGRIPDDFVPTVFDQASENMRHALLVLASTQLAARHDERLHKFVMGVIFGNYSAETRDDAGLYLRNAYERSSDLARDRFRVDEASIQFFFGSVREFIPRLTILLRDKRLLGDYSIAREHVSYALNESKASIAPAFFSEEEATHTLVLTVLAAIDKGCPQELRDAMLKFLSMIENHPRWRNDVATTLFRIAGRKNDQALLDAAVSALAVVPDHISLTQSDPEKEGTLGDRLADRVGQMAGTSTETMLKLAREFHKLEINEHARQRILAQLLAVSMVRRDDATVAMVKKLVPIEVSNPILAYNLACVGARQKDRTSMLKYTELSLKLGKPSTQFRADTDFAPYLQDKEFLALLEHGSPSPDSRTQSP